MVLYWKCVKQWQRDGVIIDRRDGECFWNCMKVRYITFCIYMRYILNKAPPGIPIKAFLSH